MKDSTTTNKQTKIPNDLESNVINIAISVILAMTSGNYYFMFSFCLSCPSAVPVSSQGGPRAVPGGPRAVPGWSQSSPMARSKSKIRPLPIYQSFSVLLIIKLFFFSGCTIFLNPQKFDTFGFRIMPFFLNHVSPTLIVTLLAIRIVLKHGQSIIRVFA